MRVMSLAVMMGVMTAGMAFAQDVTLKPAAPAAGATAAATQTAPAAVATPEPAKPILAQLKDGSKIEIMPDGTVLVLNADGSTGPVPDGVLTLRDGVTFAIRDGKRVDD